jgi:hypothetical protein
MGEHADAEIKQWRSLRRWTGERDDLPVIAAITLSSPTAAPGRPTRREPSTQLVLVDATAW